MECLLIYHKDRVVSNKQLCYKSETVDVVEEEKRVIRRLRRWLELLIGNSGLKMAIRWESWFYTR